MTNNKVLTKIAELNLKNERSKQDIALQFPKEQQKDIFIYELVRFDDPTKTFVANTTDGTINVSGFKLLHETKLYIESEFKKLFTTTGSQLTISDNRNIYGYLKEDLDYDNRSYFITNQQFSAGDSLKQVYMIDNNNQYDEINAPEIERVQLTPMAEELSFSNKTKWVLIDSNENGIGGDERIKVDSINITFKNPEIALSSINIIGNKQSVDAESTDHYLPFSIIPTSVVGNSVSSYSPHLDAFSNIALTIRYLPIFGVKDVKYTALQLQNHLGPLHELFLNILSICHMVQNGFAGVLEEGHVPGDSNKKVTPSAGWYWKTRLENKEPKAIAAEIQSLIDLNLQASLSGQIYKDIDSNFVHGNIKSSTIPSSNPHLYKPVELDEDHWKAFYSLLGAMYPQIFSNYTYNYGGGFDGDAIFPFKITADNSKFNKGIGYNPAITGDDGSEIYKYDIHSDLTITSNFSTPISLASTIDEFNDKTSATIFYYEGNFNHRTAGQVYVIDFKNAEEIGKSLSTGNLRNAQNRIISSPGAVPIGTPKNWDFINNSGWRNNVSNSFQIPQSVFENMEDPVFYYALTEDEINDYYDEGETTLNHNHAGWGNFDNSEFHRGYPKVPDAKKIIQQLKDNPNAVVEYLISANSRMRDDAGSFNDYQLVMQNPDVNVRNLAISGTKVDFKIKSDVSFKQTVDGFIPYTRPNASLVASSVGKTIATNTDAIMNGPKIFIKETDSINAYKYMENTPYSSLSDMIDRITKGSNQSYTFEINDKDKIRELDAIELSTLGEGTFSLNITYHLASDATSNIIIDSYTSSTNIYANALYIDSDESFVNTYTLINFGEE